MRRTAQVVICGAGIAGVSAAYHLAQVGLKEILVVDPRPPLSLTSDQSTECYRNWWPDAEMVALMNRSIDLMEQLAGQTANIFRMNRRGYLYLTADQDRLSDFAARAARVATLGAGALRIHSAATSHYNTAAPETLSEAAGADLLLDPELIHRHFPYVTGSAVAALHVRRAGWLSAQQLGMYLLERARGLGVRVEPATVEGVHLADGGVRGVVLAGGERIDCHIFVNAAGPYLKKVGSMLGVDIPVEAELHQKVSFKDHLQVVDRDAPLLIWADPQALPWEPDEYAALRSDAETRWLTETFPAGVHVRPEGGSESQNLIMLWDYKAQSMEPAFPPPLDNHYPEIALRGLATMLPGLARYFGRAPRPYLDGGYYIKTPDNRLLAGPLPPEGSYVIGALGGFGIMSACAAGELLAAHMAQLDLPAYAPAFSPDRYSDPEYRERVADWGELGQL